RGSDTARHSGPPARRTGAGERARDRLPSEPARHLQASARAQGCAARVRDKGRPRATVPVATRTAAAGRRLDRRLSRPLAHQPLTAQAVPGEQMTAVLNPIARSVADVTAGVIHASVEIAAPPERVFRALTDGNDVVRWWGSPDTYRLTEFTADVRVGGSCRSRGVAVDGKAFEVTGEFLKVDPPRLLVQTWNPDWVPGLKTTLTYRLDPISGGTRLTLRHEGFGEHAAAFKGHPRGWERLLVFLNGYLATSRRPGFVSRYLNPFRLVAYILILFCLGHSSGALIRLPSLGLQSDAVLAAMKTTHFQCQTSDCTWFGFYLGFGWMVSVFFLVAAAIAWYLGGRSRAEQRALKPVPWTLFLGNAANTVIAWSWFFIAPQIFATIVTVLLGYECLVKLRA